MSETFPLALRPLESAAHKPAAWFVPGNAPDVWLAELAWWEVPLIDLRLYVVPTSVRDRSPIGVLITAAGGSPLEVASPVRARPYGRLADRLYLPADAIHFPPVADDELRAKLLWAVCVLHPSAGLVGFAESDALRVHDLLAAPARRPADWDRAVPGPPPPRRLISVEPDLQPIKIHVMLDEGRGDIGSEALEQLPQSPDESSVKDALSKAARPGLKAISWLTSQAPGGAQNPTWVNHLQNWANEKLGAINDALAAARFKELQRLQEMLKSDPDKGLKYAIPMSGLGRTRGSAPPGASLTPRDVNFNLGHLGGGMTGDAWGVPWEMQQQLIAQYRAAANRELGLGRFRRAAYVFAELLGDFASAASALRQGRHYREAALLYREKLSNKLGAAECLEQGGLLTEAVALYEEMRMFLKAAGLYERLERPQEVTRCYWAAVEQEKAAGRTIEAARLLETKLGAADEALGLLDSAWPASDKGGNCLREWFDLLGRLGRHEQASKRLAAMRAGDAAPPAERTAAAAQVVGGVASAYPDAATRVLAADAARVVVGRRLPSAAQSESRTLLDVVAKLAEHDRLLRRDADRYLTRRRPQRPPAPPPPGPGKGPFLITQFRLPEHVEWKGFSAAGEYFYGHGEVSSGTFIVRGRWDGMVQGMYWKAEPGATSHVLEAWGDARSLLLLPVGVPATARAETFPKTDSFPAAATVVTPSTLPQGVVVGACVDEGGMAWVLTEGPGGYVLSALRGDGSLASTRAVWLQDNPHPPLHMAARNGHVCVASDLHQSLALVSPTGAVKDKRLPHPVTRIAASAPFTRVRLAVAMEEGGVLFWEHGDSLPFGEGMASPAVAFARDGMLVAISRGVGRAYRTDGHTVKLRSTFASFSLPGPPVAVTPTHVLNHFAIFGTDGLVRVVQLGS